jgi:uncharacterized membrane protein
VQRFSHWWTNVWERLRSSLWFVPMLIVGAAIVLAAVLAEIDTTSRGLALAERWPRVFGASAEGARELLSTIAGSMMTVVGVTFSITVVALALAASQYTSRVLRNFMRDRTNQVVLGTFVGVFAYCLVVLRTIRGGDEGAYVPALAILGALMLAIVAIIFLIYFIHHIAEQIQVASIIQATATETTAAVDRLFPDPLDGEGEDAAAHSALNERATEPWTSVAAARTGYVQSIDVEGLFDLACEERLVLRIDKVIGDFAVEGLPLLSAAGKPIDDALAGKLASAYDIGRDRTVYQDPAYGIRQIVDVALKALSPASNDSTTAVNCVDFLGAILARIASRRIDSPLRADGDELRVIARGPTFEQLLAEAFNEIRQNGADNCAVLSRLVLTLGVIGGQTATPSRRQAVRQQLDWALEAAERGIRAPHDRWPVQAAAAHAMAVVEARPQGRR